MLGIVYPSYGHVHWSMIKYSSSTSLSLFHVIFIGVWSINHWIGPNHYPFWSLGFDSFKIRVHWFMLSCSFISISFIFRQFISNSQCIQISNIVSYNHIQSSYVYKDYKIDHLYNSWHFTRQPQHLKTTFLIDCNNQTDIIWSKHHFPSSLINFYSHSST